MGAINKLQRRRGSKGIGVFFSESAGILLWPNFTEVKY